MQKPSINRMVHYTPTKEQEAKHGAGPWAALVTSVSDVTQASDNLEEDGMPLVNLFVWTPTCDFLLNGALNVSYSVEPKPGCWSWPPRV